MLPRQLYWFGRQNHQTPSAYHPLTANYKTIFYILSAIFILISCGKDGPGPTAQAFIEKARSYVHRNNTWNAIIEYRNAIGVDPENCTAFFELAENYVLLNTMDKAIKAYQTAAAINPDHIYARLRLGQIYLITGNKVKAQKNILEVLATAPQTIEAYCLLSSMQIREKNFGPC